MLSVLIETENRVIGHFNRLASRKNWLHWAAGICVLTSLIIAMPDYDAPDLTNRAAFETQIEHPFTPLQELVEIEHELSHIAKRGFRILMPLMGHVLGLDFFGCLILQHIFGYLFIFCVGLLGYRITEDRLSAIFLMFSFSLVYVGHSFFYNLNIWFDGPGYLLLLVAMLFRGGWGPALCVYLAGFSDERTISAFPILFLWHQLDGKCLREFSWKSLFSFGPGVLGCLIGLFLHAGTRLIMMEWYGFSLPLGEGAGVGLGKIRAYYMMSPFAIASPLEALWLVPGLAIVLLVVYKRHALLLSYIAAIAGVILVGFTVYDVTKSIAYAFPAVFVALKIMKNLDANFCFRVFLFRMALFCLLVPSCYLVGPRGHLGWMTPMFPKVLKWFFL